MARFAPTRTFRILVRCQMCNWPVWIIQTWKPLIWAYQSHLNRMKRNFISCRVRLTLCRALLRYLLINSTILTRVVSRMCNKRRRGCKMLKIKWESWRKKWRERKLILIDRPIRFSIELIRNIDNCRKIMKSRNYKFNPFWNNLPLLKLMSKTRLKEQPSTRRYAPNKN